MEQINKTQSKVSNQIQLCPTETFENYQLEEDIFKAIKTRGLIGNSTAKVNTTDSTQIPKYNHADLFRQKNAATFWAEYHQWENSNNKEKKLIDSGADWKYDSLFISSIIFETAHNLRL